MAFLDLGEDAVNDILRRIDESDSTEDDARRFVLYCGDSAAIGSCSDILGFRLLTPWLPGS